MVGRVWIAGGKPVHIESQALEWLNPGILVRWLDARKKEMIKRLAKLLEEGKVVIPSRFPVEELFSAPRSDAYLALKFALR